MFVFPPFHPSSQGSDTGSNPVGSTTNFQAVSDTGLSAYTNSLEERLHKLYVDSKHMDRMIDGGRMPIKATSSIWITNDGLGGSRVAVSYDELLGMLLNMGCLAERFLTFQSTDANSAHQSGCAQSANQ